MENATTKETSYLNITHTKSQILINKNHKREIPLVINDSLYIPNQYIISVWPLTLAFLSLKVLDISNNLVTWLPDLYTLVTLKCTNCKLLELPSYLPLLEELDCSNNFIKIIPAYPKLKKLNCSKNLVENGHLVSSNFPLLEDLHCSDNPINDICITTLKNLVAYDCPILVLHKLPLLIKRSSKIVNNHFVWISQSNARVDYQKILIDWNKSELNGQISKLILNRQVRPTSAIINNSKLYKFLFY
jgi:Leucine-rich repeat (LRR) protein